MTKVSYSKVRNHQLMTRATVLEISKQSFMLWLPSRTDQVPPLRIFLSVLFVYVTASLYNCLLGVSVSDLLSQAYINAHIYIYTYTHTNKHTHQHTYTNFCLQYTTVAIWLYLVITSLTNKILTFY